MLSLTQLSVFALLLSPAALANHHNMKRGKASKRHFSAARDDVAGNSTLVKKDSFSGRGTYYYTGVGACGQTSHDGDMMVALNSAQYGSGYPGPNCFKYITITSNGVTQGGVQILDECPGCNYGDLDMSPGLFALFHSSNGGTLDITWWFDGDSPSSSAAASSAAPTSTWSPSPSPAWSPSPTPSSSSQYTPSSSTTSTSVWVAPSSSSTSTSTSPPSSSSISSSSISSIYSATNTTNPFAIVSSDVNTTSTIISTSASASASSVGGASGSETQGEGNNLVAFNGLVAAYGQLIVTGAGGHVSS